MVTPWILFLLSIILITSHQEVLALENSTNIKGVLDRHHLDDDMSPESEGLALALIAVIALVFSVVSLVAINAWIRHQEESRAASSSAASSSTQRAATQRKQLQGRNSPNASKIIQMTTEPKENSEAT